jgi:hypothetical protein
MCCTTFWAPLVYFFLPLGTWDDLRQVACRKTKRTSKLTTEVKRANRHVDYTASCSCSYSCRWAEITSLNCGQQWAYCLSPGWYEYGEPRWNDIDRGNRITRRKTCPSATLSTTNSAWTDPGTNPCLRGERPATNRQNHVTTNSCACMCSVSLSHITKQHTMNEKQWR